MDKIITHSKLQVTTFNNRELNDLGKIICCKKKKPKKTEVSVKRISVCNVIEKLEEDGIQSAILLYQ